MISTVHAIDCPDLYFPAMGADPDKSVFFDIETTGFKAEYSQIYLIGAARHARNGWTLMQWMTEKPSEEAGLLRVFSAFLKPYDTIIHFNGKRFDIPYLEEKYRQYGIPSPLEGLRSIDIYQDVKGLRSLLRLEHLNQTSLEHFLGLQREDRYDGGRLIPVYHEYCKCGRENLMQLLLLHNREDVQGMLSLVRLYAYTALQKDAGSDLHVQKSGTNLVIRFVPPYPIPVACSISLPPAALDLAPSGCALTVPVLSGTLYYFFENYREYYYLPMEDQAIHKSVAAYVDKQYRRQATARTCYTRQEGTYLPQPQPVFSPALRQSWQDALTWFPMKEKTDDPLFLSAYLRMWLDAAFTPAVKDRAVL